MDIDVPYVRWITRLSSDAQGWEMRISRECFRPKIPKASRSGGIELGDDITGLHTLPLANVKFEFEVEVAGAVIPSPPV